MPDYKKFLIQQQTYNGSEYTDVGNVVDTYAQFNVVCEEFPFKFLPEAKELPKRDWPDEHGEDVFIPSDGLVFKAYDVDAKFLYAYDGQTDWASSGTSDDYPTWVSKKMRNDLKSFFSFITGRNTDGSPLLKIYDDYTKTGRRGVRYLSNDPDIFFYDDKNINAIAEFKVKFRVSDPVYEVVYSVSNNTDILT